MKSKFEILTFKKSEVDLEREKKVSCASLAHLSSENELKMTRLLEKLLRESFKNRLGVKAELDLEPASERQNAVECHDITPSGHKGHATIFLPKDSSGPGLETLNLDLDGADTQQLRR